MPRIAQKADQYISRDFSKIIRGRLGYQEMQQQDLARDLGMCKSSVCTMIREPEKIPAHRLRRLIQLLHIEPVDVLLFLGYSRKQITETAIKLARESGKPI